MKIPLQERLRLLEDKRQQENSGSKFDFFVQEGDENYSGFSKRSAFPGANVSTEYNSAEDVAYVYWETKISEPWTYSNRYYLVAMKDGRYAFFSSLSSGTCSYCSSASDDVAFGSTLEEVVKFGMGEEERKLAGLELDEPLIN